jgi:hypothetical protein
MTTVKRTGTLATGIAAVDQGRRRLLAQSSGT